MQSKFKMNPLRKKRLIEMLKVLFPEYSLIRIKRNGLVLFGSIILFIPIIEQRIHISELCIDELPKRLGKYRRGSINNYINIINQYLECIITNNISNVIDFLYQEYSNIKSSTHINVLLEDAQYSLPESKSDSITIGVLFQQTKHKSILSDIIKNLKTIQVKEPIPDQFRRSSFLISKE